jgi:hypothetical protein
MQAEFNLHSWIDNSGEVAEKLQLDSGDGEVKIEVPGGTRAINATGAPLSTIELQLVDEPPPVQSGQYIAGPACDLGPDGSTFEPPLSLTLQYEQSLIPEDTDEANMVLAYFDEGTGQWIELDSEVDTDLNTVTARVPHFTLFAAIGEQPPASFIVGEVTVSPGIAVTGELITISAEFLNTGGVEGTHTVTLKIDGVFESSVVVVIPPGESATTSFTVSRDKPGIYRAEIGGNTYELAVIEPPYASSEWISIGGVLAAGVVAASLSFFVVMRRKKAAAKTG